MAVGFHISSHQLATLVLFLLLFNCVPATQKCRYDQFTVQTVLGNISCINCPICPKGQGLSPDCGTYVPYGTHIECKNCLLGETYSERSGPDPCLPCGVCSDHQDIEKNCTLTSNAVCGKSCDKGFYYDDMTGDCQPCSWCCGNSEDLVMKECKDKGMPSYKQCDVNQNIKCQPRCRNDQYIVVGASGKKKCVDCLKCPAGHGLTYECGSIINSSVIQTCKECQLGVTFSERSDSGSCTPCSTCSVGQMEERSCGISKDRICGACKKGFYKDLDLSGECKQCSHCCGDTTDIKEKECIKQGMPTGQQCRYTLRSVEVCQKKDDKRTSTAQREWIISAIASLSVFLFIVILTAVVCYKKRYWRRCCSRTYQQLNSVVSEEMPKYEQVNKACEFLAVERPESHGSQETLSFDKSGVLIFFSDPSSYEEHARSTAVEICCDPSLQPQLNKDMIMLSPVIKLHCHGQELSQLVRVKIPHSASLLSKKHGWCLQVLQAELASDTSEIKWSEPLEDVDVEGTEVGFEISKLLAYAVVGKADDSGDPVKKRTKCAAFAGEARVGKDFTVSLYILDDCESSLEEVIHIEKAKKSILLGSLQSLHIEAFTDEAIKIEVQDVCPGWTLQTAPKDIKYERWSKSFQEIPKEDITFRHDDTSKRDFHCMFKVHAGNDITEVPVYTYFQEDPAVRKSKSWKKLKCTHESLQEPLVLDPQQPSQCLFSLSPNILHDVCMLLDMPLRKVGYWRHVGEKLGFSPEEVQDFRKENLKPDGSPCTVMFEVLPEKLPHLTVAEFVEVLQISTIRRYDVVQILKPFLYTRQQCENV